MKIIFFCGSLEQQCDGVGDYTRILSGELIRQGHEVSIISLYDKFIQSPVWGIQKDGETGIPVLRLPASYSWNEKIQDARTYVDNFDPGFLSLQFVPFSFHPKGLIFGLAGFLNDLGTGRPWHVMFHELWVGMEKQSLFKFRVLGFLQKTQIKELVIKLKPVIIHTQTKIYKEQLAKLGFQSEYLPLFANIPRVKSAVIKQRQQENEFSLVHFGTIHPQSAVMQFAKEIADFGSKHSYTITLKLLGRSGQEQKSWQDVFTSNGIKVDVLADKPAEEVSAILSESSLGIATTPIALIEKSGSAAAMLAHGFKIVCIARPWTARRIKHDASVPEGVFEFGQGNFETLYKKTPYPGAAIEVASIAGKLINRFNKKS